MAAWTSRSFSMAVRLLLASAFLGSWLATEAIGVKSSGKSGRESTVAAGHANATSDEDPSSEPLKPRLFFLFMAESDLPTEDIWARFFRDHMIGVDYEVRVHCMEQADCEDSIQHKELFRLIPTVKSEYCSDLASPMLALLEASSPQYTGHPHDKFIFVAANAVPVKPFQEIHRRLTADGNSDFCIAPVDQWLYTRRGPRIVKHHQWTVLSRDHASILIQNFSYGAEVFSSRAFNIVNPEPCLDEYWAFGAIYGHIKVPSPSMSITLSQDGAAAMSLHSSTVLEGANGLMNGRLDLAGTRSQENQGRCDTFIDAPVSHGWFSWSQSWSDFAGVNFSNVSRILHAPELRNDSKPPKFLGHNKQRPLRKERETATDEQEEAKLFSMQGLEDLSLLQTDQRGPKGPQKINFLTQAGLRALRKSQFLFARKMDPAFTLTVGMKNLSLYDALEKYVFTD